MLRLTAANSLVYFWMWLKRLVVINFAFFLMMTGFRVATLLIYGQTQNWSVDLWRAFALGFRFDGSVLGYLLALPVLYLIICLQFCSERGFQRFGNWSYPYYLFFFSLVSVILALDLQYYSYFQDHLNILIFAFFEDDTWALLATFWKNYPVLWYFAGFTVFFILLKRFLKHHLKLFPFHPHGNSMPWLLLPLIGLTTLTFVFLLGRGSFGLFPLTPADAVISKDPFINHLPSNGVHAIYRAVKLRRQQNAEWDNNLKYFGYSDPRQAFADFYQIPVEKVPDSPLDLFKQKTKSNPWAAQTRPHVVVFMMESFGTYWLKYHSPEFNLLGDFEKHMKEDVFLKNFLPSASSTTGSLSSIMISAPHRPIGAFLTESQYLQVPFRSSPARIFSQAGYETRFIYGGNPGWRDMNKFAKYQGFQFVEGDVDIETKMGKLKEVHDWGVYDEDLFRYVLTLLREAQKPQMLLVMTTTNHPPYQIPSTYLPKEQKIPADLQNRLIGNPQIAAQRFLTYQYSCQKLGEFLNELKAPPLGEKTLFAATGDHGFWLINFSDEEVMGKWSVPFYMYAPKALEFSLPKDTFGSHMDIFPTLYNLSLSETEYQGLGVDLTDPQVPHYAFHSSGLAVGPEGGALLLGKSGSSFYDWNGRFERLVPGRETPARKSMAARYMSLMALLDFYFLAEKKKGQSKEGRDL